LLFFEFKRVFCLDRTQGGVHFHVCKQYITLTEVQLRTLKKKNLADWSRNSENT
jgi:hypothetical protein